MEKEIVEDAIKKFEATTGFKMTYKADVRDLHADGWLCLAIDNQEICYKLDFKQTINRAIIGQIAQANLKAQRNTIVVTRNVSSPLAEQLKSLGIFFLDTAGNAFIKDQSLFIFSKGNKLSIDQRPESPSRAFNTKGLQVIFTLLNSQGSENLSYRKIADISNVALGTVQWVMEDLKKLGYLIDMGKQGRKLVKKEDLLSRWTIAYSEKLKPKLLMGRYKANTKSWWVDTEILEYDALWGGEVAGSTLSQNLKPEIITIYTEELSGKLILEGKLKKDPNGNVEIVRKFWRDELRNSENKDLVPPILVYADLITSTDERNIEIANAIYEKEIAGLVR